MTVTAGFRFIEAVTPEQRRAVFRFRYQVYVEEMGRYQDVANHHDRLFEEPVDSRSRIYCTLDGDDKVVGTGRLTRGGAVPLPARMVAQFALAPFLEQLPAEQIAVGERGMIAAHLRGTDLLLRSLRHTAAQYRREGILLVFGACEPHLLSVYLKLGYRSYAERNINSPESGYLIPIVLVPGDAAHFRAVGSPLAFDEATEPATGPLPEAVRARLADGGRVTSRQLSRPDAYWGEVHAALSALAASQISALDGFSAAEFERCLEKSNIIECERGDHVLKKGGVARNLFVLLEGTLEVRDGQALVRVLSPGDVFGEIGFLLGTPRSMDIYAATEGVRVLSLSESNLRRLIEGEPRAAATLLMNISKMLCWRLLKH